MQMFMGVNVVQRQAGRLKGGELRFNLRRELPAHSRPEEKGDAGSHHVVPEHPPPVDKIWHLLRRQHWLSLDQDKMESDAQTWQALSSSDRIGRGGCADHQARRCQYPVPTRLLDCIVDLW